MEPAVPNPWIKWSFGMTAIWLIAVLFVAAALGVISVGAFDFGRDLKRLMTQSPVIINLPAQGK